MVSLILIGEPKSLHIPVMAMQLKTSRESSWAYPTAKSEPLEKLIGGNASRWIRQKQQSQDLRRVVTRNYIPHQTAFYANWMVFVETNAEKEFLDPPMSQIDYTFRNSANE